MIPSSGSFNALGSTRQYPWKQGEQRGSGVRCRRITGLLFKLMRYKYDDREPANSYEVSWVLSRRKPHFNSGITREELEKKIPLTRRYQIREWMEENFTHQWFLDRL